MKKITNFLLIGVFLTLTTNVYSASITGKVVYDGERPKLREIKMDADPICLTHHTGAVLPQLIVLGENNELANIFVRVKSGLPKIEHATPTEAVVISQKGCMYDPHVVGVMVNQTVKILNPDGTLHNVHALPKVNAEFNLAMPKFRKEVTKTFEKPEFMFPIKCDVHPWMGAWVSVMPHPYFAVTKEDGLYSIENLPAGEYEIEAWQEKLGTKTVKVTLTDDESKEIDFSFSKPTKK